MILTQKGENKKGGEEMMEKPKIVNEEWIQKENGKEVLYELRMTELE